MNPENSLYLKNRRAWRQWLQKNHQTQSEIWLIYYKKHTGKPRIPYDDAVEEAICYGWIDSTVKRLDEERYCQRYTPRKKKSQWSATNVRRLKKMLDQDKMTKAGLDIIPAEVLKAAQSGNIVKKGPMIPDDIQIPSELENALKRNQKAQKNWDAFPPSRRKQIIYWVLDAKRPETTRRRIAKAVKLAEDNVRSAM
ncbi:MAG: hypothetical protein GF421_00510 [Candidatus Aminicenantes bacterium]|nr:hypothetical protein [Candidatus Aminicenantes bacterium]